MLVHEKGQQLKQHLLQKGHKNRGVCARCDAWTAALHSDLHCDGDSKPSVQKEPIHHSLAPMVQAPKAAVVKLSIRSKSMHTRLPTLWFLHC
jgi:hypothetical protein